MDEEKEGIVYNTGFEVGRTCVWYGSGRMAQNAKPRHRRKQHQTQPSAAARITRHAQNRAAPKHANHHQTMPHHNNMQDKPFRLCVWPFLVVGGNPMACVFAISLLLALAITAQQNQATDVKHISSKTKVPS